MNGEWGEIGLADPAGASGSAADPSVPGSGALFVLALEDGTEGLKKAIAEQLEAVALWWEKAPPDGPGFVKIAPAGPPVKRHDVERFLAESGIREVEADVPLVLYVTGHGVTSGAAKHYTVMQETDRGRLLATGMRTTEIVVAALDSHARDVLVVVNMCEAADIGGELLALERDLATDRSTFCTLNVLATAAPKMRTLGREFALVLREAHAWQREAGDVTRPYLTMAEFNRALHQATKIINARHGRNLVVPRPLLTGKLNVPTTTLPNPGYRPDRPAVEDSRQEVAATLDDMDYWLEKASGRPSAADAGWYFSGRKRLNRSLTSFLASAPGVLIVSGTTASGKSAILGRAVTLSDATFRSTSRFAEVVAHCPPDTVPDEGAVTVAVTARNREPLSLLRTIGAKLGATADPSGRDSMSRWQTGLKKFLSRSGPMITIVVDSLDEASDPSGTIQNVLVPLAGHLNPPPTPPTPLTTVPAQASEPAGPRRGVRLVVAVRSSRPGSGIGQSAVQDDGHDLLGELQSAFDGAVLLRTDDEDMQDDIRAYVRALLHGADVWAGQDLKPVSRTVAEAVERSFLDARTAADQLRAGGPRLLRNTRWRAHLHEGTVGLLKADLERSAEDGLAAQEALALLRATAFALGRGIAWGEVWPAVASAMLQTALGDADEKIRTLLGGRLAGYLTRDVEDDHRVYRPAHERLAAVLRSWPAATAAVPGGGMVVTGDEEGPSGEGPFEVSPDDTWVHARIAEALAELAGSGSDTGTPPHPYVRRYLARHARLGAVLDDRHVPADVLPWVTGSPIRGLLASGAGQGSRHWLEAWATVEPYLHRADYPSRLASLHLAYAVLRFPRVPGARTPKDAASGARLSVLWSQWAPPANVLATVGRTVQSLTALTIPGGRTVLAAGDEHGGIELIDAVEGTAIGERIVGHEGAVRCLISAPRPGQHPMLVSGSTDGTVRIWDPAQGALVDQVHRPGSIWIGDLTAYRDAENELALLCVNGAGKVVWWNERMGPQDVLSLPGENPRTSMMTLTSLHDETGRSLLAIGDGTSLSILGSDDRQVLAEFTLTSTVRVLTSTTRPGQVAAGHTDGTVTVWDTGGLRSTRSIATRPVTSLAALTIGDRHLLAAGAGKDIAVWDTGADTPPALLTGHTGSVTALSLVTAEGITALASASTDNTLRLWNQSVLEHALGRTAPAAAHPTQGALAFEDGFGPSWFALGGSSPHIDVWDIAGGSNVTRIDTGQAPLAMAWAQSARGRILLWAAPDHTIRLWDAATSQQLPDAFEDPYFAFRALAPCTTADGRHLLLTGGDSARVSLWDLDRRTLLHEWRGHAHSVRAVAAASDGRRSDWFASAGADGTVRLWSIEDGPLGKPIRCSQGLIAAIGINLNPAGDFPQHLASAGDDGTIRLWDLHTHRPLGQPLEGHTAGVHALTLWTTDGHGSFLASGSGDGTIRIWNAATGRCLLLLATGSPVRSLASHPGAGGASIVLSFAGDAGVAALEVDLAETRHSGV